MARNLVDWANAVLAKWGDKISAILGLPVPGGITFSVADLSSGNVAETVGTHITLDRSYFEAHSDDAGAVVHEIVHAVQQVPGGTAPSKTTEGVADFVRWKLGLTTPGWKLSPTAKKISELTPEDVVGLSEAMASGDFSPDLINSPSPAPTPAPTPGPSVSTSGGNNNTPSEVTGGFGSQVFSGGGPPPNNTTLDRLLAILQAALGQGTSTSTTPPANIRAAYFNLLDQWGIPLTDNLSSLIDRAVSQNFNGARFLFLLRQTPEYQQAFPGIFNPDGTLKMSEAQYLAVSAQYASIAAAAGLNFGPKKAAFLFQNDKSPAEFQAVASAIRMLNSNPELYKQFGLALKQEGVTGGVPTKQEMLKFVLGEAPAAWYKLWNLTNARYAATQAGISLGQNAQGRYEALNPQAIQKIANKALTPAELASGFQQVAQNLLTTLPLSRIQNYGLTKKDILQASFGGPKQAEVLQQMQHILAQEAAFSQDRAAQAITPVAGGGATTIGGSAERASQ